MMTGAGTRRWRGLILLAGIAFTLAGCLPSSCRETESRSLYPADSLSRQIAAAVAPDTLVRIASFSGSQDYELEYVRSLAFGSDGALYAADAARGTVIKFDDRGRVVRVVRSDLFSYPYVAGVVGDTVLVFSPGRHRIQSVHADHVADMAATPNDVPLRGLLQYVHRSRGGLYAKLLGEEFEGFVGRVDPDGPFVRIASLTGPSWRRAGFLKSWGDTLLSLNGYRPMIDLVLPDGQVDSLRLIGFDSPMLSRRRLFELGQIDTPPLLTASAAAEGNRLFVLNMRPGWLRVDVYDRSGRLAAVLTEPDPVFNRDYYPTDLAVRELPASSAFRIAVAVVRPEARIDLLEWRPAP